MRNSSRYSDKTTDSIRIGLLDTILLEDKFTGWTIEELKAKSIALSMVTTQKIAREASHLINAGLLCRAKNKAGKVLYGRREYSAQEEEEISNERRGIVTVPYDDTQDVLAEIYGWSKTQDDEEGE
jgi:hypothetical protein